MQHVIFEVLPAPDGREPYLSTAARLRPMLEASGGCLALERFDRDDGSGWVLSMQRWRDEAALERWRRHGEHGLAQARGRARLFDDYRLRVATRLAAGGTRDDLGASPAEGGASHERPLAEGGLRPEPGVSALRLAAAARVVAVLEWTGEAPSAVLATAPAGARRYTAILEPTRHALVTANTSGADLSAWAATAGSALRAAGCLHMISLAEIDRDYGKDARAEAPARDPA